jgi:DNA repair protein RadA/Sms
VSTKTKTAYRCTNCGVEYPKWGGRCESCGEWSTLVEEIVERSAPKASARVTGSAPRRGMVATQATRLRAVSGTESTRLKTGLAEFDFVLGGGIVPGSMVLVGGEPGIGKSTLLLQVVARLQGAGHAALYVSGEESALQVKLRADRLGDGAGDVEFLPETHLETIIAHLDATRPQIAVIDSIQTVHTDELEGAPGNVGQVRECAARLMRTAKELGTAIFVVGHVTKGGGIAGPKTLEHIVDTVLYFEGESGADYRLLRATKNRFGSVDEIGVFSMDATGLQPVANPSSLFMGDRSQTPSGSALTAPLEGTRPLLVEIQGLAAKAGFGTPQRVTTGYDPRRLALLLAVLEKRAGLGFAQLDAFVNVVGGIRLTEPSGDCAVAMALASSVYDRPLPADALFLGEIGLGGEIRAVSQLERRLSEGARLGLSRAYVGRASAKVKAPAGMRVIACANIRELVDLVFQ